MLHLAMFPGYRLCYFRRWIDVAYRLKHKSTSSYNQHPALDPIMHTCHAVLLAQPGDSTLINIAAVSLTSRST